MQHQHSPAVIAASREAAYHEQHFLEKQAHASKLRIADEARADHGASFETAGRPTFSWGLGVLLLFIGIALGAAAAVRVIDDKPSIERPIVIDGR